MVIIVADSIFWTYVTRKMAPFEVLTTVEGEQYEFICYHISNTYHHFQKIGKFAIFFHHYIGQIVGFWTLMLSSYGRKEGLRKCKIAKKRISSLKISF